ncbi:winged helix-turn-helix transcriptional regulator [Streptomyces boncukensis]|uniref:Helix-turn-helix transcriptional regulator n=1 Tax=Streptomyces boncukensis TaxID=2711219 RepID=A0A6G4X2W2_9ACTN|nr:helix-turn-helix domain-containing protein [Streptomyces boncukensis]NGO71187.1 helix-turn-helix transcriptional regulator [Streptomyces boncukensis]
MALKKGYAAQHCSLARTLELVGERWTMLVVRDAFYGVRRFSDFQAHLDVPRAVLSARLGTLTEAGILEKRRYEQAPPRDEYVLTERGRQLWPALYALLAWGEAHASGSRPVRRYFLHQACGCRLDPAGGCPECGLGTVPPGDIEVHPGPGADHPDRQDPVSRAMLRPHRLLEPLDTVPTGSGAAEQQRNSR